MKNKSYAAIALVVVFAVGAFWCWSPVLALRQMQTAAQNGDAETFNAHVDYPKLRESLKGQFSAMVAQKMGAQQDKGNRLPAWVVAKQLARFPSPNPNSLAGSTSAY